jgi:hypothetical protein
MKRGASLIEIILAVSLVGLIILFLFGLLPSTGLLTRQAEHQVSANQYAKELTARLGSVSFSTLKAAEGAPLTPSAPGFLGPSLEVRKLSDTTLLTPEVTIQSVPPVDRLVQATIVVRWKTGRRNKEHRIVRRYSSVLR